MEEEYGASPQVANQNDLIRRRLNLLKMFDPLNRRLLSAAVGICGAAAARNLPPVKDTLNVLLQAFAGDGSISRAAMQEYLARMPEDGHAAIHFAEFAEDIDALRLLVGSGADINQRDSDWGATPHDVALDCLAPPVGLPRLSLLEARNRAEGGDGNSPFTGLTVLQMAVTHGWDRLGLSIMPSVVQTLLDAGADPRAVAAD